SASTARRERKGAPLYRVHESGTGEPSRRESIAREDSRRLEGTEHIWLALALIHWTQRRPHGRAGINGKRHRGARQLLHSRLGPAAAGTPPHRHHPIRLRRDPLVLPARLADPSVVDPGRRPVETQEVVGKAC